MLERLFNEKRKIFILLLRVSSIQNIYQYIYFLVELSILHIILHIPKRKIRELNGIEIEMQS